MNFALLMSITACVSIVAIYFVWGRKSAAKPAEPQAPAQPAAPSHES